jgi:hypothetical protein
MRGSEPVFFMFYSKVQHFVQSLNFASLEKRDDASLRRCVTGCIVKNCPHFPGQTFCPQIQNIAILFETTSPFELCFTTTEPKLPKPQKITSRFWRRYIQSVMPLCLWSFRLRWLQIGWLRIRKFRLWVRLGSCDPKRAKTRMLWTKEEKIRDGSAVP